MAELVILGNGFDISVGLKTKYSDFFEYLSVNGDVEKFETDLASTRKRSFTIEELNEILTKFPLISFWEFLFHTLKSVEIVDWNNVEKIIEDTLYN